MMDDNIITTGSETTKYPVDSSTLFESLKNYILLDIDILQEIGRTENPNGYGRCTTALAGLCFSVIEQIGFLITENLSAKTIGKYLWRNQDAKTNSFSNFFFDKVDHPILELELMDIFGTYRHKVVHNIFPDSISQDKNNGIEKFEVDINGTKALNVNWLSNYVKTALQYLIDNRACETTIERNLELIKDHQGEIATKI